MPPPRTATSVAPSAPATSAARRRGPTRPRSSSTASATVNSVSDASSNPPSSAPVWTIPWSKSAKDKPGSSTPSTTSDGRAQARMGPPRTSTIPHNAAAPTVTSIPSRSIPVSCWTLTLLSTVAAPQLTAARPITSQGGSARMVR